MNGRLIALTLSHVSYPRSSTPLASRRHASTADFVEHDFSTHNFHAAADEVSPIGPPVLGRLSATCMVEGEEIE